ncbi:MAG: MFS transporter [Solirubrobacteraceae bacterium]
MSAVQTGTIETNIPSRLDRLPWSRFHWMVVLGLGTVWILDGFEVTVIGTIGGRLTEHGSGISMTASSIGLAGAIYVIGACLGALFFGQLTDRFGRKKLFMITLAVYLVASGATAFSFAPWYLFLCRFVTGAGIGGEYAAINSAIDELIPARMRGRVDLTINGSFWVGSIIASALAMLFLDVGIFPRNLGWRLEFGVGVILAFGIMLVRRHVPESPRWLFIHGREQEAERIVAGIERDTEERTHQQLDMPDKTIKVRQRQAIPFREIARVAFKLYPKRAILCLALFIGQAFIYNGITFNLGTLFTTFFKVSSGFVPVFIIIYGVGNFLGPLLLGRLFDTVGRKPMIAAMYLGSALITIPLALVFDGQLVGTWVFEAFVFVTFFLASAGASAAYLTASEIFPMETRAMAIAFFYACGTAAGGIAGPLLFGTLINSGDRGKVEIAFFIGAAVMAVGGIAELLLGVRAERAQLEDIAKPLTVEDAEQQDAEQHDAEQQVAGGTRSGSTGAASPDVAREHGAAHRERELAARERARAAEHRAAAHESLAAAVAGGNGGEAQRQDGPHPDLELELAEIVDATARAHDELATFHDELAAARQQGDGPLADAARERARAAGERAEQHEQEAQALAADTTADAERHGALAAAALERARAHAQQALALEADSGGDDDGDDADLRGDRADLHRRWAGMHAERAESHRARADGDEDGAAARARAADESEQHARAAAFLIDARERLAEAEAERREQEVAEQRAERAARDEQRAAEERQLLARLARRSERERHGLRRFRPGPGRVSGSPGMAVGAPAPEQDLSNEIDAIARAVAEHGPIARAELARVLSARYWGPGVFRQALHEAVDEGAVVHLSRTTLAAPGRDGDGHPGDGPG